MLSASSTIVPSSLRVGPGGDGDLVLAALVDHDHRDAGGCVVEACDGADVDALGGELAQRLLAEVVGADGAHHRHLSSGAGGGDRLVGALAAAMAGEGAAGDGLAGVRQASHADHEVGVDRSDDDYLGHGWRGYGANVNCGWVGR